MGKKDNEKIILNKIYNTNILNIIETEEPDFIIESKNEIFGVEITEFYYNESTARLINYNGYKEKILNSKDNSILDKSDIGKITRKELYIYNEKENNWIFLKNYIGIRYSENEEMNVFPNYKEVENKIINIIDKKNNKAKKYQKLKYLELIIQDKEGIKQAYLKELSTSKKIITAIKKSKFKRLYIITGNFLFAYGDNPGENINKYSIGSDKNV